MLQPKCIASSQKLLVAVLLVACLKAQAANELRAPGTVTLHTVVPTECTMYFSWQSLGIQYSHRKAGQVGPITRIISCTEEQKQSYKVTRIDHALEHAEFTVHSSWQDQGPHALSLCHKKHLALSCVLCK